MPDSTRKVRVNVTQRDIDKATDGPSDCPVARALRRKFPNKTVAVYMVDILIEGIGFITLPEKVVDFVDVFDTLPRSASKPMRFTLTVPA